MKKSYFFILLLLMIFFGGPLMANAFSVDLLNSAQKALVPVGDLGYGESASGGVLLLARVALVIKVALGLLGAIIVCIFIYSGYMWMTSGNSDRIKKAKGWMINAVIGLAIALSAYAITDFVVYRLVGRAMVNGYQEGGIQDECWDITKSGKAKPCGSSNDIY